MCASCGDSNSGLGSSAHWLSRCPSFYEPASKQNGSFRASPQLGGTASDDGELHTRLPHPNIIRQYGARHVSGRGTMCAPVPTFHFSTSIALCPDLNLKCATGRWDGQTTGCDFLWGFPPGKICLTIVDKAICSRYILSHFL